ncbi:BMP family ABC transporter substrate-binding protein [Bacillus sp. NEB1478]|uniref:BMP family lipoprotein n=1 Tax=Bacillus sp. NEB1478 TaxID=3073816 RepID=UPI002872B53C|nr:BMP family ABC transporter substrate-binding protein [Bacillus sp. NEB1478]WNB90340.1 BMP family ABC transporter substrate-binding protein [Bacillus sp. NEB1478]
MKKKLGLMVTALLTAGTILSGCGSSDEGKSSGDKKDFKVAMVTDTGGVDDKSFNQSAWEGLTKYGKDNGLTEGKEFKYLQSTQQSDYKPNLNSLVRQKYDLVFGIGFLMGSDVETVAKQQPDAKLAIVDMVVKGDNVANITFSEHEGSFLVGLVAGLQTKSNKVGFVGGVNSELIKKFENGFKAGVKTANPNAEIMVQYAEDFNKAEKGQQIANTFYEQGADIIYHAAGGTGMGVFTEAKNRAKNGQKVWVIGVDRDQHEEGMPENVTLTSMVKRVDKAVFEVSEQTAKGKFPGGKVVEFGLKQDGVGIAPTTENVSKDALAKVDEYKKKIIDGEVKVPKTDDEFKEFQANLK